MTNLVVEVSRYLIILLIAIYTYYNFRFFSMKDQEGRDLACSRQLVCMFMLHFLANMVIVLNTGLESLALFYGAQVDVYKRQILRLFKKYEGILQYEKKIGFSAQNEK